MSFIENALPALFEGKTLAESMIRATYLGENIIVGDPTFYYTTELQRDIRRFSKTNNVQQI